MQIYWLILYLVGGYLWGSISIARIVTRIVSPENNIENIELPDRNTGGTFQLKTVGATTASVVLGPKIGGLIGILDILKGAIPCLIIRLIFPEEYYFLFTGFGIIVGHIWPIYFKFRGGGGLSPTLGVMLVAAPLGTLIAVVLAFLLGMFVLKEIAFAVLGGPVLFIIWSALIIQDWYFIGFSILANIILIIAVIPDVQYQLKAKKAGKTDLSTSMDSIPMGQMMKKMMTKMGVSLGKTKQEKS